MTQSFWFGFVLGAGLAVLAGGAFLYGAVSRAWRSETPLRKTIFLALRRDLDKATELARDLGEQDVELRLKALRAAPLHAILIGTNVVTFYADTQKALQCAVGPGPTVERREMLYALNRVVSFAESLLVTARAYQGKEVREG